MRDAMAFQGSSNLSSFPNFGGSSPSSRVAFSPTAATVGPASPSSPASPTPAAISGHILPPGRKSHSQDTASFSTFRDFAAKLLTQLIEEHEREVMERRQETEALRAEISRLGDLVHASHEREQTLKDQLEQATRHQAAQAQATYEHHAQLAAQAQMAAQAHLMKSQQHSHELQNASIALNQSLQSASLLSPEVSLPTAYQPVSPRLAASFSPQSPGTVSPKPTDLGSSSGLRSDAQAGLKGSSSPSTRPPSPPRSSRQQTHFGSGWADAVQAQVSAAATGRPAHPQNR